MAKFNLKDESELDKITDIEILTQYPEYFIKIFCFWTGLTENKAYEADKEGVYACVQTQNHLLGKNTSEKGIDRFEIGGVTYLFPQSEKGIGGSVAYMAKESFGAMIYALQQEKNLKELQKGRFDVIADQMAILCRPEGEVYNPSKVNERAKIFQNLTMDIVWEFVFFSIRRTNKFKQLIKIYSQEGEAEVIKS
jgi:hypothetical protein